MENNLNKWKKSEKTKLFTVEAPPQTPRYSIRKQKLATIRHHHTILVLTLIFLKLSFLLSKTQKLSISCRASNGQSLQGIDFTRFFSSIVWREESSA
jgi:hypothetical protein